MRPRGPIAIDGPAASGKSTVARGLAQELSGCYISTGEMYRAVTWLAQSASVAPDAPSLGELLARTCLALEIDQEQARLLINGSPPPQTALRTPQVSEAVSHYAQQSCVRDWLIHHQREASNQGLVIMEGRDIGTVVFPDAPYKFFITATPEERARRRLAQSGEVSTADLATVAAAIAERDRMDSQRALAPLRQADDAVLVDTTTLSVPGVVLSLRQHIEEHAE